MANNNHHLRCHWNRTSGRIPRGVILAELSHCDRNAFMDLLVLVDRVMVEACLVVDVLSWLEVILFVYFCKQLRIGFA